MHCWPPLLSMARRCSLHRQTAANPRPAGKHRLIQSEQAAGSHRVKGERVAEYRVVVGYNIVGAAIHAAANPLATHTTTNAATLRDIQNLAHIRN